MLIALEPRASHLDRRALSVSFCGALELANLVELALVYMMDKDAHFRMQKKGRNPARQGRATAACEVGFPRR